jgi:G:T/U-mismatch repair DNA glycosylase
MFVPLRIGRAASIFPFAATAWFPMTSRRFFDAHPQLELICFNGAKAGDLFRKHVKLNAAVRCVDLPSTSPAHAAMSFAEKVKRWSVIRPARRT